MKTPGTEAGVFFDDDYRRLLAPFHTEEDARREVAALRELLALSQDDRILDLGCGWGRHLTLLAGAGHDVSGIDRSPELLRQVPGHAPASTAHAGTGPGATPRRPPLVAADMRALPLADGAFDVVLNLATSLGLFLEDDDVLLALREARRVLRPDGRLLIEGMHRDDVVAHFAPRDRWFLDDGTEVHARRRFDPLRGVSHEVLRWRGPAGEGEKRHALRIRSATEMVALMQGVGFTIIDAFGDWDAAAFEHTASRLLILGRPG